MSVLRKDLRAISADGAAANIMVGIGENYLPAFVLALTASQVACGLTPTVPQVLGAILQLAAPYFVDRVRSYRRWVVLCAAIQAAVFLPLSAAALTGSMSQVAAFLVISLYWATGLAGGPAWNTWVATLIPERLRARLSAHRSRIAQGGLVLGILVGGLVLQSGAEWTRSLLPFALLFLVAGASRSASAVFLAIQGEPLPPAPTHGHYGFQAVLEPLVHGNHGRVLVYMLLAQVSVQISSPYFTPYMLCQLKLSYAGYVALTAAAYVARIAFLPIAGRMAARWGASRLLWIGALAITPMSVLWVPFQSFAPLLLIQGISGVAWSMYELAMLLVFVENIPADCRVGILTLFNLANALAILVGSLIGGAILSVVGETRETYWLLFTFSSLGRGAAVLVLAPLSRPAIAAVFRLLRSAAPRPAILSLGQAMAPGTVQSEECLARPKGKFAAAGRRAKLQPAAGTHATAVP